MRYNNINNIQNISADELVLNFTLSIGMKLLQTSGGVFFTTSNL